MATKQERRLHYTIILLAILLAAALGGCGYYYNKIAGFESQKTEDIVKLNREHATELAVAKGNLKAAEEKLTVAEGKIAKFSEKETAYKEKIDELRGDVGPGKQKQALAPAKKSTPVASPEKKKHTIVATNSQKTIVAAKTIKTVHKTRPAKKMKPRHIKKAHNHKNVGHISKKSSHGKKHAHINKKTSHAKKQHKSTMKKHEKIQTVVKDLSLSALCEEQSVDRPFFLQLTKDAVTYGYTAKVWEVQHGSTKNIQILLTSSEMPNS
ncbi:hypothetical protein L6270_02745 [Candidatus Parcubacteria bacterium]|nr:hypothetical protein [Patescibacteria group bacterium]MBU4309943.1 hypothetical protein [Patescibacteria group bacterium]MBU4432253.1 hypothetical protein [Patescibacteria group bacterium]MBU4577868.1 hypothetical protein [Patescibacteria group bacterium]MCG2696929.1 hypothetical protein [Candidatus Parcubacteria bacterium]